jgi:hypothetical protein
MTPGLTERLTYFVARPEGRHKLGVRLFILLYFSVIFWALLRGFDYYRLPLGERAFHALNRQLRPSGVIGIRLALMGVVSFCFIYLYPFRKRWQWLSIIGKTRNWLDVHVVMGTGAPVLITLHAAFRTHGLAGTAYWIMMVVVASGFIGRYLYAQIPRRLNAAEFSLQEMQSMTDELAEQIHSQSLVSAEELKPLLAVPNKQEVEGMPVLWALLLMFTCDLKRPFLAARVRRRAITGAGRIWTIWGLLPSSQANLERVIELARQRSWVATKISFLAKTQQVFHLWHVVHRPFSISFAILAIVHICVALTMGYY